MKCLHTWGCLHLPLVVLGKQIKECTETMLESTHIMELGAQHQHTWPLASSHLLESIATGPSDIACDLIHSSVCWACCCSTFVDGKHHPSTNHEHTISPLNGAYHLVTCFKHHHHMNQLVIHTPNSNISTTPHPRILFLLSLCNYPEMVIWFLWTGATWHGLSWESYMVCLHTWRCLHNTMQHVLLQNPIWFVCMHGGVCIPHCSMFIWPKSWACVCVHLCKRACKDEWERGETCTQKPTLVHNTDPNPNAT